MVITLRGTVRMILVTSLLTMLGRAEWVGAQDYEHTNLRRHEFDDRIPSPEPRIRPLPGRGGERPVPRR